MKHIIGWTLISVFILPFLWMMGDMIDKNDPWYIKFFTPLFPVLICSAFIMMLFMGIYLIQ